MTGGSFYLDRDERVSRSREEAGDLRRRIFRLKVVGWGSFALWVAWCLVGCLAFPSAAVVASMPFLALVLLYVASGLRARWESLSEALAEHERFLADADKP